MNAPQFTIYIIDILVLPPLGCPPTPNTPLGRRTHSLQAKRRKRRAATNGTQEHPTPTTQHLTPHHLSPTSDLPPTQFRGISLFIINNESFHKMEGNQIVVKKLSNAVFSS